MVRTLLGSLCALLALVPAAQAGWTAPALLSGCPPAPAGSGLPSAKAPQETGAPLIVYPSSEPQVRSGAGALLWNAAGPCTGGAPEAFGAPLRASGLPGAVSAVSRRAGAAGPSSGAAGPMGAARRFRGGVDSASGLAAVSAAVGTTAGQVLVLGSTTAGTGAFVEGGVLGTFPAAHPLGGPAEPAAAASGYLGDAVVVSLAKSPPRARARASTNPPRAHVRGSTNPSRARARGAGSANDAPKPVPWALAVRVQRHYSSASQSPLLIPVGDAPPDALAVAVDFRGDLLLVWAARGAIYARALSQGGAAAPVRRVASVAGVPELRALFSDDGRAIVAWREQAGPSTSIQASVSDAVLRFRAPRTVERFEDPPGLVPPRGSLRLVRLSSEAVMMAWTGMRSGRYVVCASPVSLRRGVWAPVVVSAARASPGSDRERPTQALLADLVPGPRAEVLALWTAAPLTPRGKSADRAIEAAWGHYGGHGEARFAPPEAVSAPGPNGTPAAAFDPQNDRALAAWVTGSSPPRIAYSQRSAGAPGAAPAAARSQRPAATGSRSAMATSRTGGSGVRPVWLSALGLLLIAAAGAARQLSARRRGVRGPRGPARWEGRVRVPRERARRQRLWRHHRR